jgi:hypothetical protein
MEEHVCRYNMVWVITLYWYHWQRVTTVGISGSSREIDNYTGTHTLNQPLGETNAPETLSSNSEGD